MLLVPVFETLPECSVFFLSASWTSITSPGFSAIAFRPVEKVTTSFSSFSVKIFHLPNLCACPWLVQPVAITSFEIILPVSNICWVSSTISTACW